MNRFRNRLVTLVIGLALLMSGCSVQNGLQALDRAATPDDTLPSGVALGEEVKAGGERLLATRSGVRYFAGENEEGTVACLAMIPSGADLSGSAGCGNQVASEQIVLVTDTGLALSAMLVKDGVDTSQLESAGWTRIHENVLVAEQ
ncbi:hypothetical protein M1D88_01155 [Arthrobacter sp. R1-13]